MKFLKLILVLPAMLFAGLCFSQPICGFDPMHRKNLEQDSVYRKSVLDNESRIKDYITKHKKDLSSSRESGMNIVLYTIPVVVHVIHTGGAIGTTYNPTDAQITGAIDYLNQVYNGTYPGTEGVGDVQIQFVLASRDPNCNASTGIDRIDGSSLTNYTSNGVNSAASGGVSDLALKNFDRWDPTYFYNIWVVNKIDASDGTSGQFIGGYAYFAGASASRDGTVMLATQMATGKKTLPHEIGHALNLYHPFEGSADASTCPANADCTTDGDKVCDTDPVSRNLTAGVYDFTCRTGANSCTSGSPPYSINTEHNYMGYTNCYTLFTAGQRTRMQAAMSLPGRASLANSLAIGSYPVTPYTQPVASCTPVTSSSGTVPNNNIAGIIKVSLTNKSFISGGSADDVGYVNNTIKCMNLIQMQKGNTYSLSVSLAAPNDDQLRVWIDYNNDGVFSNATEQIYYNPAIASPGGGNPAVIPISFTVPGTAATNSVLRMRVMDEVSTGYGAGFAITSACYNPTYGQAEDYPVYLSAAALPVRFEYFRGAKKDQDVILSWKTSFEQNAREFQIEKSTDGISFSKTGTIAATNISTGNTYSFTDKSAGTGKLYYRLKEVDIDLKSELSQVVEIKPDVVSGSRLTIINNPFTDQVDIVFNHTAAPQTSIQLFDVAGRKVYENQFRIVAGQNIKIDLSGYGLKPGIYILRTQSGDEVITEKLMKK